MSQAQQITTVTIEFWQLIGGFAALLMAGVALIWTFTKIIARMIERSFKERDEKLGSMTAKVDQVEKDLLRMRGELSDNYVRRDDWIRFSAVIDAKLEALRDKGEATQVLLMQAIEHLRTMRRPE